MTKIGHPPYLECSSKGDRRFSALFATVDGVSIEESYQAYKIFEDGSTGLPWREAKGKRATNMDEAQTYYVSLWRRYLMEHPELILVLKQASGLSDMFGKPGCICQAEVLWHLKEEMGNSPPFRVIVAGGRTFQNYELLKSSLDHLLRNRLPAVTIVSGTASGADTLGERWAQERGLSVARYPADWNRYGKSAGYRRNEQMAQNADALVAFWDGESRGTMHMINIARQRGLLVRVVKY